MIDKVFHCFIRYIHGVKATTSKLMVLGESRQMPPSVVLHINVICYVNLICAGYMNVALSHGQQNLRRLCNVMVKKTF